MYKRNKLVFGLGKNDYYGNLDTIKSKPIWSQILQRCSDQNRTDKNKSYGGCEVEKGWLSFTSFIYWFHDNYVDGWHLDKDILFIGNKIYGPDTCCFVPKYLNLLIVNWHIRNGVHLLKNAESDNLKRPYYSNISLWGKSKSLGTYATAEEANRAWRKAKAEYIVECIEKYRAEPRGYRYDVEKSLLERVNLLLDFD